MSRAVLLLVTAAAGVALVAGPRDASPAIAAAADTETPTVTVLSEDVTLMTTSHLRDIWHGNATRAFGWVLVDGPCPAKMWAGLVTSAGLDPALTTWTDGPRTFEPVNVLQTCRVPVRVSGVALAEPASGLLVLRAPGLTAATVSTTVVRTSGGWVYATVFLVALAVGLLTGAGLRTLVRSRTVPSTWKFSDAYASTTTGLVAAAAALLTASGVLGEYAPQYATGGVLAANIAVAALVLLAPLTFTAFVGKAPLRAFSVAAGITLVAATAQALLVVVVLVSGSTNGSARGAALVLAIMLIGILVAYAVRTARAFPKGTPPEDWHPGSASL